MKKNLLISCCMLLTLVVNAQTLTFTTFSTGYNEPLAIAHAGDARLFVVERGGTISICDSLGVKLATPFLDITSIVGSGGQEQGLLGLVFHPDYKNNGYFYVNYTDLSGNTHIARFSRNAGNPNLADAASEFTLFTVTQPAPNHNGGTLHFGKDGYLYIALGDGGMAVNGANSGQNPGVLLGKILRIDVDNGSPYSIPADNPFVGNGAYEPEIWSMGVRNPWKFSFDRLTGDMWIGDVGDDMEELDFHEYGNPAGNNYGWPCHQGLNTSYVTNGNCVGFTGATMPIYEYDHIGTSPTACSIIGGYRYRGAQHGSIFGNYYFVDWCNGEMFSVNGTPGNWTVTSLGQPHPTYVVWGIGEDQYGEIYMVMGNWMGTIRKMIVSGTGSCTPEAFIIESYDDDSLTGASTLTAGFYPTYTYQWQLNGVNISGATQPTYNATQTGHYSVMVTNPNGNCTDGSDSVFVDIASSFAEYAPGEIALKVYPNPTENDVTLHFTGVTSKTRAEIINSLGEVVESFNVSNGNHRVSFKNHARGTYYVKVTGEQTMTIQKIIVF